MDQCSDVSAPAQPKSVSVGQAMLALLRNPWQNLVLRWNGKAALLSAMFRGVIFLVASIKSHHAGRSSGMMAEALFGALGAGFFGTLTQSLRFAEPQWVAGLLLAVILPALFQIADFFFHAALGTQVFHAGMISSAVFTAFAAAFNLYIMRRGAMLVGEEGRSFWQDMSVMPRLVVLFVVAGVVKPWRFAMEIVSRRTARGTVGSL